MGVRVRLVAADRLPAVDPLLAAALVAGVDAEDVRHATGQAAADLATLQRRCLLEWRADGARAIPLVPGTPLPGDAPPPPADRALSRFAVVHREGDGWLVESGLSPWQVRLDDDALSRLADPGTSPGLHRLLAWAGMLADADEQPSALGWEPHDRWFAARSRSDAPRPAGARLAGIRPAEPARRVDPGDGERLPLPVPEGPRPQEPTLWQAGESRRSVRAFADVPVRLADLAELLWRTLRVVEWMPATDEVPYERVLRPVPSGGAMHATDLWLLCSRVEGVPAGLWRYDPFTHELVRRDGPADSTVGLGPRATEAQPPVTGLLTARHARTSWKYRGIALALELKDVGVIMEAVQLTAGAVGLGMCPWGSGPTIALARALGVDPELDMPVGEFILGVPA